MIDALLEWTPYVLLALLPVLAIASLCFTIWYVNLRQQLAIDNYTLHAGPRPKGKFFSCPKCLRRNYVRRHLKDRYCPRCKQAFGPKQARSAG